MELLAAELVLHQEVPGHRERRILAGLAGEEQRLVEAPFGQRRLDILGDLVWVLQIAQLLFDCPL